MKTRPLLKDVAERAGVSEMTASRALRDTGDVSARTRARVHEAAQVLGYVPNRIAGALSSKRVNLVGVVVPSMTSFVFPEVLNGITAAFQGGPLKPVIGLTGYDLKEEEDVIREMLSWQPSGLIVAGLEHSDGARAMLTAATCPVVEIMDVDGSPVQHCVGISHLRAGRDMATELLARGYSRIGFVGTKMPYDFRAEKRLKGFLDVLQAQGIEPVAQEHYSGPSSIANGRALTKKILDRTPGIECLYFSSDVMAVGAYMHTIATGLSVPGDLAIAGFNNLELLDGMPITLATSDSLRFAIGKRAAEIVASALSEEEDAPIIETYVATLLPGQSI